MNAATTETVLFEQLLERHYGRLLDYVQRRIDPRLERRVGHNAVLHEGLEQARRRWLTGERPDTSSEYIWLFNIVRDRLCEEWRHHSRQMRDMRREEMPLPPASSVQMVLGVVHGGPTTSGEAQLHELAERIRALLNQLKTEDREIIELRGLAEMSYKEIDLALGIPGNTACKRYTRAVERLREELGDLFGDGTSP